MTETCDIPVEQRSSAHFTKYSYKWSHFSSLIHYYCYYCVFSAQQTWLVPAIAQYEAGTSFIQLQTALTTEHFTTSSLQR